MKRIWLVVVAALFPLTISVAFAGQVMSTAPGVPEKAMEEQKGGGMGMQMEDKKMEGAGMKMEEQKANMGTKMEEKKMEGAGMKMEKKM